MHGEVSKDLATFFCSIILSSSYLISAGDIPSNDESIK